MTSDSIRKWISSRIYSVSLFNDNLWVIKHHYTNEMLRFTVVVNSSLLSWQWNYCFYCQNAMHFCSDDTHNFSAINKNMVGMYGLFSTIVTEAMVVKQLPVLIWMTLDMYLRSYARKQTPFMPQPWCRFHFTLDFLGDLQWYLRMSTFFTFLNFYCYFFR